MKSWFSKGKQRIIKTYGKHESLKLSGIIDYETGKVFIDESDESTAETFLLFMKKVLVLYPTGKIVMVLDNSKVHHAILLEDFLKANPRLMLMFLPPYSPNLNIIEGLWKWLKNNCINNVFYAKFYQVRFATRKFVSKLNSDPSQTIERLCIQM
jgi:transposase